eukprot:12775165-Alexandrium_andersonii.AAC.1
MTRRRSPEHALQWDVLPRRPDPVVPVHAGQQDASARPRPYGGARAVVSASPRPPVPRVRDLS